MHSQLVIAQIKRWTLRWWDQISYREIQCRRHRNLSLFLIIIVKVRIIRRMFHILKTLHQIEKSIKKKVAQSKQQQWCFQTIRKTQLIPKVLSRKRMLKNCADLKQSHWVGTKLVWILFYLIHISINSSKRVDLIFNKRIQLSKTIILEELTLRLTNILNTHLKSQIRA